MKEAFCVPYREPGKRYRNRNLKSMEIQDFQKFFWKNLERWDKNIEESLTRLKFTIIKCFKLKKAQKQQ